MPATAKRIKAVGYDLSNFESGGVRQPSGIRVVRRRETEARDTAIKAVLCFVIALCIPTMVIYNYVLLNELTADIGKAQAQYEELVSDHRRLLVASESQLSIRKIEERARDQMGMAPIEGYQIEYVQLEEEQVILPEVPPTMRERVESAYRAILEYLDR